MTLSLADPGNWGGFIAVLCLIVGIFIILHAVWAWSTGEIKIIENHGGGFSPNNPSRIVDFHTNPQEFRSTILTRIAIGIGIVLLGLVLPFLS